MYQRIIVNVNLPWGPPSTFIINILTERGEGPVWSFLFTPWFCEQLFPKMPECVSITKVPYFSFQIIHYSGTALFKIYKIINNSSFVARLKNSSKLIVKHVFVFYSHLFYVDGYTHANFRFHFTRFKKKQLEDISFTKEHMCIGNNLPTMGHK